jgi:hypothetical protein
MAHRNSALLELADKGAENIGATIQAWAKQWGSEV